MRNNQPVTDREVRLEPGEPIVSWTDLKGRITKVNDAFVRVSGYTASELIGEPHNLVRHPDMPAAAFADLWEHLKEGRSWTGLVKNRCKNGDYYWVSANVSPVREGGAVTGYMSVRSKPMAQQVEEAEALYRGMASGAATPPRKGSKMAWLTIRGRLLGLVGGLGLPLLLSMAAIAYMSSEAARIIEQNRERSVLIGQIARLAQTTTENHGQMVQALLHDPRNPASSLHAHPLSKHLDAVRANLSESRGILDEVQRKTDFSQFREQRDRTFREATEPMMAALEAGSYGDAYSLNSEKVTPLYNALIGAYADKVKALREDEAATVQKTLGRWATVTSLLLVALAFTLSGALALGHHAASRLHQARLPASERGAL
jgi:methyl-accepting chemotaxis protein